MKSLQPFCSVVLLLLLAIIPSYSQESSYSNISSYETARAMIQVPEKKHEIPESSSSTLTPSFAPSTSDSPIKVFSSQEPSQKKIFLKKGDVFQIDLQDAIKRQEEGGNKFAGTLFTIIRDSGWNEFFDPFLPPVVIETTEFSPLLPSVPVLKANYPGTSCIYFGRSNMDPAKKSFNYKVEAVVSKH